MDDLRTPRALLDRHRPAGRHRPAAAALCAAVLVLAGCGGDAEEPAAEPPPAPAAPAPATPTPADGGDTGEEEAAADLVITIAEFAYDVPDSVAPGAEVTVRNEDSVGHTVTADEEGGFDVVVGPGEEATLTAPEEPGEYPFHCTPHPSMTGTLVVG